MLRINKETSFISKKFDYKKEYFPKPGMLGTEYVGSDRYAVVCVSVDSPKKITISRLYGLDENNVNDNPDIHTDDECVMYMDKEKWMSPKYHHTEFEKWFLNKKGSWKESGGRGSSSIHWGIASPYRDMDF